jgi:hypothetical protein
MPDAKGYTINVSKAAVYPSKKYAIEDTKDKDVVYISNGYVCEISWILQVLKDNDFHSYEVAADCCLSRFYRKHPYRWCEIPYQVFLGLAKTIIGEEKGEIK